VPTRSKFETDQQFTQRNLLTFANGLTSGSTDNSGSLVINYLLADAPRSVVANSVFKGLTAATNQYYITVANTSATGSTLRFFGTGSGLLPASIGVTASWAAWV
jgi:hypothetical protein